jgi:hypothetical protein
MPVACAILVPVALAWAGIIPTFRFNRERIEVTVHPSFIEMDGIYVYANPLPIPWSQGLRVPFAVDPSHPAPATVEVPEVDAASGEDLKELAVRWFGAEPYFSISIPAFSSKPVRVRFTQYSPGKSATYLLTTTRPWGRPLEEGEYAGWRRDGFQCLRFRTPPRAGPFRVADSPRQEWASQRTQAFEPQRGDLTKPRPTAWVRGTQTDSRALKGRNNFNPTRTARRRRVRARTRGGGFIDVRCK